LIRNADDAMYLAKENGRNKYQFFGQEIGYCCPSLIANFQRPAKICSRGAIFCEPSAHQIIPTISVKIGIS